MAKEFKTITKVRKLLKHEITVWRQEIEKIPVTIRVDLWRDNYKSDYSAYNSFSLNNLKS